MAAKKGTIIARTETNVLMIGNGFDINYHLPTKYSNFLHVVDCIWKHVINDRPLYSVAEVFADASLQEEDVDIKRIVDVYGDKYDAPIPSITMEGDFGDAGSNEWFQYLKKTLHGGGWVDFEREIKIVIKWISFALSNLIEETKDGVYLHFPYVEDGAYVYAKYVCEQFPFFFEPEKKVQSALKIEGHADAPTTLRHKVIDEYAEKPIEKHLPYRFKKAEVADCLFEKLEKLSHMLRDYLYWFVDKPVGNIKNAGGIGDNLLQTWPWTATQVISFNYTHTLNELYGVDDNPRTHYIHGEIGGNSDLVLGVDSDDQDEIDGIDTTFVKFKKYYQRANYGTDSTYIKLMCNDSLYKTYDLYVIGHSLDVTDREVIDETFSRAKSICVFFHNDSAREKYIRNLIGVFGKEKFESLRKNNKLRFVNQENLHLDWEMFHTLCMQ